MKRILSLLSLLLLIVSFTAFSQTTEAEDELKAKLKATDSGWKTGGVVNVNFSQAAFSTDWPSGGTNSMTLTSLAGLFANYSDGANVWDNNLDLGYGFSKLGSDDLVKSEDKIDLTSKYGREAFRSWYYAALFNFKSQMTPTKDATDSTTSEFLSPGAALFAVGMDYKPNKKLTAFISPITYKADMIMNDEILESIGGVDENGDPLRENVESQIGGYLRVLYKQALMENVNFESKLEAFSNYDEDPQNLYITWDNLLAMKVNEYITANITFNMINRPGEEVVYKEVLGIGLSYVF
ncbi:MAG: DUF3078 domain-containing protein [Candidatus Delongbacteria bacterium]